MNKFLGIIIVLISVFEGFAMMQNVDVQKTTNKIYLAGGCFWGIESYFSKLPGVVFTEVGFANGKIQNPTYQDVLKGDTDFAETVLIEYNPAEISLPELLSHYFEIVDLTTHNRQANDVGTQYRSGIYYDNTLDKELIEKAIAQEQTKIKKPIVTEVKKLENFYVAEEYHQKYLDKNKGGYCHIDLSKVEKYQKYKKPEKDSLKELLTPIQYDVTQKAATERPFSSDLVSNFEDGIYVDIATGEPLFSSKDKYESGCGWPSFSRSIEHSIKEKEDKSMGMDRIEVRSSVGNSHLGHVFDDGPIEKGGRRYCINGAALKFIPVNKLQSEGYGEYLFLFK